ncbi:S-adenosyl-L-methionine-dependent methyltransferase [Cadophora sp. MPI-SDFR-AT-0126]|nr:S-adenosyl-L-methionine-dependent methyltransferase [Leotiomycetes sp. MPI-SDFR-AT-0126]
MPRLPPSLLLQAYNTSPFLPLILRGARTLDSAINELRWLREHVQTLKPACSHVASEKLLKLCQRRSRGEPLQYILGSQPFGELDIKCRPGVLIPRPETESYTTYLAKLANENRLGIKASKKQTKPCLRILDVCSGSGCISLLLHSLLSPKFKIKIFGLDISKQAIDISRTNLSHNVSAGYIDPVAIKDTPSHPPEVQFSITDIFAPLPKNIGQFDIIISNPPYISRSAFNTQTTRSVRNYEPKQALVPIDQNPDVFYKRLIRLHQINLSQVLVMEVGDAEQAIRVAEMAFEMNDTSFHRAPRVTNRVEIWRDNPDVEGVDEVVKEMAGQEIRIRGQGKIRAVVMFRVRTDKHARYKEQLNLRVLERLDEPDVGRDSERERQKQRKIERNEAKERRARSHSDMMAFLDTRRDLGKNRQPMRGRKRVPGSFGQS